MNSYRKTYGTREEYNFRIEVFAKTLDMIEEHNAKNGGSLQMGLNKFSDWTENEFQMLLGYIPSLDSEFPPESAAESFGEEELSSDGVAIDWRTKGAVTAVKD